MTSFSLALESDRVHAVRRPSLASGETRSFPGATIRSGRLVGRLFIECPDVNAFKESRGAKPELEQPGVV
jgi:hypothetical protein